MPEKKPRATVRRRPKLSDVDLIELFPEAKKISQRLVDFRHSTYEKILASAPVTKPTPNTLPDNPDWTALKSAVKDIAEASAPTRFESLQWVNQSSSNPAHLRVGARAAVFIKAKRGELKPTRFQIVFLSLPFDFENIWAEYWDFDCLRWYVWNLGGFWDLRANDVSRWTTTGLAHLVVQKLCKEYEQEVENVL